MTGHSRGSAYPLHISYYWKPKRLVFFCGLEDYQGTRGGGTIRPPLNKWAGKRGLSTPAPWVQGYQARAKALDLVPPQDMFGIGPFVGTRALVFSFYTSGGIMAYYICFGFLKIYISLFLMRKLQQCADSKFNSNMIPSILLMCWMHLCTHT